VAAVTDYECSGSPAQPTRPPPMSGESCQPRHVGTGHRERRAEASASLFGCRGTSWQSHFASLRRCCVRGRRAVAVYGSGCKRHACPRCERRAAGDFDMVYAYFHCVRGGMLDDHLLVENAAARFAVFTATVAATYEPLFNTAGRCHGQRDIARCCGAEVHTYPCAHLSTCTCR
jgi:hypothetical protein